VLLGDLPRLRSARLKQTDEYIVNAYRAGEQATVHVQVRLHEQSVRLTRTGNRSGSLLIWESADAGTLRGQQAEAALAQAFGGGSDLDLASSLNACGLLSRTPRGRCSPRSLATDSTPSANCLDSASSPTSSSGRRPALPALPQISRSPSRRRSMLSGRSPTPQLGWRGFRRTLPHGPPSQM